MWRSKINQDSLFGIDKRKLNKRQKWNIIAFTIIRLCTGAIHLHRMQCIIHGFRPQVVPLSALYPKAIAKITTQKHHPKSEFIFGYFFTSFFLMKTFISFHLSFFASEQKEKQLKILKFPNKNSNKFFLFTVPLQRVMQTVANSWLVKRDVVSLKRSVVIELIRHCLSSSA